MAASHKPNPLRIDSKDHELEPIDMLGSALASALDSPPSAFVEQLSPIRLQPLPPGIISPQPTPVRANSKKDPLVQKRGLPPLSLSTSAPASPMSPNPIRRATTAIPSSAKQLFTDKGFHRKRSVSSELAGYPKSAIVDDKKEKKTALYKTELCRSWEETGACRYGNKCQFAHSFDELRNVDRHPKYKTEMCKTYWEKGTCPYGKRCCFIHERETRSRTLSNDSNRPMTALPQERVFEYSMPLSAQPASNGFDEMNDRIEKLRLFDSTDKLWSPFQ